MTFKPGKSGNPSGRAKDKLFRDALNVAIKRVDGDKTRLAAIAEALVEKAMAGDVSAINAVADRLDGKPHQTAEVTHFRATAANLSDDELAGYLPGDSGEGVAETQGDPPVLN